MNRWICTNKLGSGPASYSLLLDEKKYKQMVERVILRKLSSILLPSPISFFFLSFIFYLPSIYSYLSSVFLLLSTSSYLLSSILLPSIYSFYLSSIFLPSIYFSFYLSSFLFLSYFHCNSKIILLGMQVSQRQ